MTQATQVDACRHGYAPGGCPDIDCRNSLRAKLIYLGSGRALKPSTRAQDRQLAPMFLERANDFARIVASEYRIRPEWLLGRRRTKLLSEARLVLYYVCRRATSPQWSFPEIAILTQRDHTTVISGVRSIARRAQKDKYLRERVARIMTLVQRAEGIETEAEPVSVPEIPDLEVG